MAKRTPSRRSKPTRSARKPVKAHRSGKRPNKKIARQAKTPRKAPRLNRPRRTLADIVPTPPSSLNLDRHGSAVRTELAGRLKEHGAISPAITGGDVDADWEDAYFTGEEAPGGDNPTPDQDVVDDIGRAVGVQYQDNEELKSGDKVVERDKHRWELDPASAEDYKERK